MVSVPVVPISIVSPSGALRTTVSTPTLPPAPVRFSTVTGWPSFSCIRSASTRATTSVAPPGGKGTTMRSGRVGAQAAPCAAAIRGSSGEARAASARLRREKLFMVVVSLFRSLFRQRSDAAA